MKNHPSLLTEFRRTLIANCLRGFIVVCCVAVAPRTEAIGQEIPKAVDFVREIQPILRDNCYECHAGNNEEGGLNLGVKAKALDGGESGAAIHAGKGKDSLLIRLVSGAEEDRWMPPEGKKRLTKKQTRLLRACRMQVYLFSAELISTLPNSICSFEQPKYQ